MVSRTAQRKIDNLLTMASDAIEKQEYLTAIDQLQNVIALNQRDSEAWHLMGLACNKTGRSEKAEEFLFVSLSLDPKKYQSWVDLARTQIDIGKNEDAKKSSLQALKINPQGIEALKFLGNAIMNQKKFDEALPVFCRMIEYEPEDIYANWGVSYCLYKIGRIKEIAPYLKKCMDSGQILRFVFLMYGQYIAETESKVLESIEYFNKELMYDTGSPSAYAVLGRAYASIGELEKSLEYEKKHLEIKPGNKFVFDNLIMHIHYNPTITNKEILDFAMQYQAQVYPEFCENEFSKINFSYLDLNPSKAKLRMGFVSGDFRKHAIFSWLSGLMSTMQSENIEIYCYCNNEHDLATEIWKSEVNGWRDIKDMDDEVAVEIIKNDKIDILVDLSGHTALNRLGIFARKPAPVQVTWLGQAGPIGIKRLDYMITDKVLVKEGEEADYLHKVYRMPNAFASFVPPEHEIEVKEPPCLQNGFVTLGCFNNFLKINYKTLGLWSRIMQSIPNAHLYLKGKVFKDPAFVQKISIYFTKHNIEESRLTFDVHDSSKLDYLKAYNKIDIALDPFPLGGGTTTHDLLWMGVPMVTLYGNRMSNRISSSTLKHMSCDEMIAYNEDEYLHKVVELAADFDRINNYKKSLRDKYLSSSLCDTPGFARDLEQAFRDMWFEICSKLK